MYGSEGKDSANGKASDLIPILWLVAAGELFVIFRNFLLAAPTLLLPLLLFALRELVFFNIQFNLDASPLLK